MSTEKCYFCSGALGSSKISAIAAGPGYQKKVWFCIMACYNMWKFGPDWGTKEEPNIVY